MIDIAIPLILFLLPLAYSPGPGNLFFAALGARAGMGAAAPALLGYHVATLVVTVLIGLGFAGVMGENTGLAQVIRYAGAAYVLWLAWKFARAGVGTGAAAKADAGVMAGAMLLLLNPKAYVIIGLMFSQFLTPQSGGGQVLGISVLFTLNNLVAFCLWAALGDQMTRLFRGPQTARRLNLVFAAMLAIVAVWMALG